jgi:DNA polymerase II large subunit
MARFIEQTTRCKACGTKWKRHEQKETDVHFSLTFLEDAVDDVKGANLQVALRKGA